MRLLEGDESVMYVFVIKLMMFVGYDGGRDNFF